MSENGVIYDVLYAPIPDIPNGFYVRIVDFPGVRMDVAYDFAVAGNAISCIASHLGVEKHEVAVRVRQVDSIPGRDAPLRVESLDTHRMLAELDAELGDVDD